MSKRKVQGWATMGKILNSKSCDLVCCLLLLICFLTGEMGTTVPMLFSQEKTLCVVLVFVMTSAVTLT